MYILQMRTDIPVDTLYILRLVRCRTRNTCMLYIGHTVRTRLAHGRHLQSRMLRFLKNWEPQTKPNNITFKPMGWGQDGGWRQLAQFSINPHTKFLFLNREIRIESWALVALEHRLNHFGHSWFVFLFLSSIVDAGMLTHGGLCMPLHDVCTMHLLLLGGSAGMTLGFTGAAWTWPLAQWHRCRLDLDPIGTRN